MTLVEFEQEMHRLGQQRHIAVTYAHEVMEWCKFAVVLEPMIMNDQNRNLRKWTKEHLVSQCRIGFFQDFTIVFLEAEDDAILTRLTWPSGNLFIEMW